MPVYHSAFNEQNFPTLGNVAVLPLKSKIRGPAPVSNSADADIVDEALDLFRANCFFRNFEIKGPSDRVLIYLLLFTQECLAKISKSSSIQDAQKNLNVHALGNFCLPGDGGFPLNALYERPATRQDSDNMRAYFLQLRQELAARLVTRVYTDNTSPSKWWMSFAKRKFMNISQVSGI